MEFAVRVFAIDHLGVKVRGIQIERGSSMPGLDHNMGCKELSLLECRSPPVRV
jgi:hypothetical protein